MNFNVNFIKAQTCLKIFLVFILIGLILSISLLSLVPPVSRDALIHHLALPKLYLKYGGIYEIPSMVCSYFPMNLDLLYMIPLYFGNDIAPKFIHFSFALMTAWMIFGFLRRRTTWLYALTGAFFFLSIPIIIKLSITVYVDLGLVFFSTAAILLIFRWIENQFKIRYLVCSAVCCGLAMGTKYNGLITFFLLSSFVAFIYSRHFQNRKTVFFESAGRWMLYVLISLMIFSPWMIRNWHWKKNPIYPMYNGVFQTLQMVDQKFHGSIIPDTSGKNKQADPSIKKGGWNPGVLGIRKYLYGESTWQIILLPLRIFFEGKDGNPQYFDGKLNPFLLILSLFAFMKRSSANNQNEEKKILLFFIILFFVFSSLSAGLRIRYILPIIPPLVILSVYGVRNIIEISNGLHNPLVIKAANVTVAIMIIFCIGLNLTYVIEQFKYVKPVDYLTGYTSRDQYIEQYRFEYPAMRYINEKLPYDARIYFLFLGKRGYYCDREYLPDNAQSMKNVVENSADSESIYVFFKKNKVTHILVFNPVFDKWRTTVFNTRKADILKGFFQMYLTPEFTKNDVVLYRLNEI